MTIPLEPATSVMSDQSLPQANSNRSLKIAVLILLLGCAGVVTAMVWPAAAPARTPVVQLKAKRTLPHDQTAFCQGLVIDQGRMFEGTGHYGESTLRKLDSETGQVSLQVDMPDTVFGEGITVLNKALYQLTWKENVMLTYNPETLERTGAIPYRQIDRSLKEGWGLTHNGSQLIISDGTSTIRFVDAKTMKTVRRLRVKDGFRSVTKLNELEFIQGDLYANVWYSDRIARIDSQTGRVKAWLDATSLRPAEVRGDREAALNGIAWDSKNGRMFITGKNWPVMYEVTW